MNLEDRNRYLEDEVKRLIELDEKNNKELEFWRNK